jgi:predicted DNA-binding WGR domain protein
MEIYLVFVDTTQNNNKFWSAKIHGNQLIVRWGRVGYNPQTKMHNFTNPQQAISKYNNLVFEKKAKGYQESQPQIDSCSVGDIRRALQLLVTIRASVGTRNFTREYFEALNQYLKLVPTPLGMQIDPQTVYRTVEDVDHQIRLLNLLLPVEQPQQAKDDCGDKVVSLKAISKSFWRNI